MAVGVQAHAVAELAAEQLINGHAQRLADQIKQRDVDARQRRDDVPRQRAVEDVAASDFLEEHVPVHRVFADEQRLHVVQQQRDAAAAVNALANARDALIRLDLDERVPAVTAHDGGCQVGDFHDVLNFPSHDPRNLKR